MAKRASLLTQSIVYVGAVMLVFQVGALSFNYRIAQGRAYRQTEARANALVDEIGFVFDILAKNYDVFSLRRVVEQTATIEGVKRVGIADREGRTNIHAPRPLSGPAVAPHLLSRALETERRQVEYGSDQFVVVQPLHGHEYSPKIRSDVIGVVVIEMDLRDINASLRREVIGASLGTALFILSFGVGLVFLINGKIIRPIKRLVDATKQVASGDWDVTVRSQANRELDELAGSFAAMSRALMERQEQLWRARESAEAASREKSAFLASMSHELRTPLNAIIGYSELLEEESEDFGHASFVGDLKKIQTAGRHLLALINNILDISKIEAGKMEIFVKVVELAPILQNAVTTVQPLIEKNSNRLEITISDDAGVVMADPIKLQQVLINVLGNAAKFTTSGAISMKVVREAERAPEALSGGEGRPHPGERILLQIADTGIGISAEDLPMLFNEFGQLGSATSRKYGGTGLGLSLSRRFCRMMNGDITVESRPGGGSTFTVSLPAATRDDAKSTSDLVPDTD